MPNMSYCRFENTSNDLGDCVSAMEEVYTIDELKMSSHERQAMDLMNDLCTKFLIEYARLVEAEEEESVV